MTTTPTQVTIETARRSRRLTLQVGEDVRRLRVDANVSMRALAAVVDVDPSTISRIEAGLLQPSLERLIAIGIALGADLSLRYFAGAGPRLHDRFQAPMVEAFLRALDPRWRVDLEVPISHPARGVIDLVLTDEGAAVNVASEAYSDLRRLEQQIRWSAEKADGLREQLASKDRGEGSREVSRLLILRTTTTTRDLARQFEATLAAAYPARTGEVIAALTSPDAPWPGAGIVWMNVHGTMATLMRHPPPGVRLGR